MSRHGNLQALSDGVATERNFDVVIRGYSRREVDRYVNLLEGQLSSVSVQRQENETQLRNLSAQLHRVQMELLELRRRPESVDKVTFRHLGPRAEQILALAEEQADAIRADVTRDVEAERAEVERLISGARERAEGIVKEAEDLIAAARTERSRERARLSDTIAAEQVKAASHADRLRSEAEQALAAAKKEAELVLSSAKKEAGRLTQAAAAEAERLRAQGVDQAQALRSKAEKEAAALGAAAEHYAQQTRTSAEQHSQQTRSAAEHSASEVVLQAERHATQIRSGAEQHAVRLHATAQDAAAQIQLDAERAATQMLSTARSDGARQASEVGATGPDPQRPDQAAEASVEPVEADETTPNEILSKPPRPDLSPAGARSAHNRNRHGPGVSSTTTKKAPADSDAPA